MANRASPSSSMTLAPKHAIRSRSSMSAILSVNVVGHLTEVFLSTDFTQDGKFYYGKQSLSTSIESSLTNI